jgi:hypothetical protein
VERVGVRTACNAAAGSTGCAGCGAYMGFLMFRTMRSGGGR